MNTSPEINILVSDLAKARQWFPSIPRNKTVKVRSERGNYDFTYATLDVILDTVCPILGEYGLVIVQAVSNDGDRLCVETRLAHRSGQWIEMQLYGTKAAADKPMRIQDAVGSQTTFLKRYSVNALLAIEGENDDDGNAAEGQTILKSEERHQADPETAGAQQTRVEEDRLTKDQVDGLYELMNSIEKDRRIHGMVIRQAMGLTPKEPITKKLLLAEMSRPAYQQVYNYFSAKLKVHTEGDVPDHAPPTAVAQEPTQQESGETITEHPLSPPSDVPEPSPEGKPESQVDADERDRIRLRAEVAQWDLPVTPEEIEYIIQHNVYSKARALLWNQRRKAHEGAPNT